MVQGRDLHKFENDWRSGLQDIESALEELDCAVDNAVAIDEDCADEVVMLRSIPTNRQFNKRLMHLYADIITLAEDMEPWK